VSPSASFFSFNTQKMLVSIYFWSSPAVIFCVLFYLTSTTQFQMY